LVNDTLTEPFPAIAGRKYNVKVHIIIPNVDGEHTVRFLIAATPEPGGGSGAHISDSEATKHIIKISGYTEQKNEEDYTMIFSIFVTLFVILTMLTIVIIYKHKKISKDGE